MDSTRETHNPEFESKVSELLPDLAQLLKKPGVPKSDDFAVNLGIDLSELQSSLASHCTMSCNWDSSQGSFICSPTSPDRAQLNNAVESKLSEMLPDLGQVLDKNGISEPFTVNLGIDLSELASLGINSAMRCCFIGGKLMGISSQGFSSGLFSSTAAAGDAGNLIINTGKLIVRGTAAISTESAPLVDLSGQRIPATGRGSNLTVNASESVELTEFGQISTDTRGSGDAGDLTINTGRLLVQSGSIISATSSGLGNAGNIAIDVRDTLQANANTKGGTIVTTAEESSGGAIDITAGAIRLQDNSDITTFVSSGTGGGGNITLNARSIVALDDSDILAFSRDGRGGNITLNTPAFFGENYTRAPRDIDLDTLDRNNRVDINATGTLASGTIVLPDTTFIQNSLTELPDDRIDTDSLLANSCIVRRNRPTRGSFTVTGTGGLQERPGDVQMSDFPTVDIETLPSEDTSSNRSWQKGDPIVEPQGVYRLPNGKIVLSRECS